MALDFDILNLKKNEDHGGYHIKIKVNGFTGEYHILTDAKMIYNDWLPKDLQFSVLDGFDCPFNGEPPYLRVRGLTPQARKMEGEIKNALVRFIQGECSGCGGE